jgi:filamentous hemagglutinin
MSDESMASGSANAGSGSGGPAPKPAAAAGGKDIPPHELGKLLGAGGEKEVYAYGEKQAVGVLKPGRDPASIDNEVANLAKLRQEGLPAANASKVTVGGKPAILFEQRFVQGSKEVVRTIKGKVSVVGRSPYLNARSAADLRAIRQTLIDKQVSVKDLQFLIAEDGKVVIADPLGVVEGAAPSRTNLATIDKLIQVAEGR